MASIKLMMTSERQPLESRKVGFFKLMRFSKSKVVGTSSNSGGLTRSSRSLVSQPSGKRRGILKKIESLFYVRRKVGPAERVMEGRDEHKEKTNGDDENVKWQVKEIVSRDGAIELKCSVRLASYDMCSVVEAAREGACSVIAAVVAHWMLLKKGRMPNRAELDKLMVEGAVEWKKLGENVAYKGRFPDKRFDIETVFKAGIRPLRIKQDKSVIGFFSPEKFELLKEAVSIDVIWSDIERKPGVYIVSWNGHFCVLKVEKEACYVIDSPGERLTEGVDKAFVLKFDESSLMKLNSQMGLKTKGDAESMPNETSSLIEAEEMEARGALNSVIGEDKMVICRGRECCKEYFKRFLAASTVRQQEVKEEKGIVGSSELHKRLQIKFQYTTRVKKMSTGAYVRLYIVNLV